MVDVLMEDAKKQGYQPDCAVAGDEVRGRLKDREMIDR